MWLKRNAHQRARELLSAYIDGELSPQEKVLVEEHLRECVECRRELETLRRTVAILRAAPRLALPRSFVIRRADVEGAPAPSRVPAFLRVVAALGAAAFILVVGALFFLQMFVPGAPAPMAKALPGEKSYRAVEETATVVMELKRAVTKEVAKEVPAPPMESKKAPQTPAPELGVEVQALSPVPTPTAAPPVALSPSGEPSPKPAVLLTPTPAPATALTPSPLPRPELTTLQTKPTPTPSFPYGGELTTGLIWTTAALVLVGVSIGLWVYHRRHKSQ